MLERLRRVLVPRGQLVTRTIRSGVWSGATNTFNRLLQLAKMVVLARLLPPVDFGILGIGFLVLAVFQHFSKLGLDASLIQRADDRVDEYLNTLWLAKAARGVLIFAAAYLLAPHAAALFDEPRAIPVIRVLGLSPLLMGFRNPGIVYFVKDLEYHKRFVLQTSGTLLNFFVALALGVLFRNVWALVVGTLVGSFTTLVVSYLLHGYRPDLAFDLDLFREMFDYGKWILGSSALVFLLNQGDNAFVGWFAGASALAFYQMAARISGSPATEISDVISNVIFPAYSKVQNDRSRFRSGFFRTLEVTSFVSFPAAVGLIVVAPLFVRTFLGVEWLATTLPMQILAVWGGIRSLGSVLSPVFAVTNRPDINTKLDAARLVIIVALIYPLTDWFGLAGTASTLVVSQSLVIIPMVYLSLRTLDASVFAFLSKIAYPLFGSMIMGAIVWTFYLSVTTGVRLVDFSIAVGLGVASYFALAYLFSRYLSYGIDQEVLAIYRSFRSDKSAT